uniref:Uncharacterized protein n=1 Tax=Strigamia maritima TaxID=126957 RepID=T1IR94_STRMM
MDYDCGDANMNQSLCSIRKSKMAAIAAPTHRNGIRMECYVLIFEINEGMELNTSLIIVQLSMCLDLHGRSQIFLIGQELTTGVGWYLCFCIIIATKPTLYDSFLLSDVTPALVAQRHVATLNRNSGYSTVMVL